MGTSLTQDDLTDIEGALSRTNIQVVTSFLLLSVVVFILSN